MTTSIITINRRKRVAISANYELHLRTLWCGRKLWNFVRTQRAETESPEHSRRNKNQKEELKIFGYLF